MAETEATEGTVAVATVAAVMNVTATAAAVSESEALFRDEPDQWPKINLQKEEKNKVQNTDS